MERCRRRREVDVDDVAALDCRRGFRPGALGQLLERAPRPGRGRRLVVEIAVDPRRDPVPAQRLEPRVDPSTDLAEVDVAGIAEGEDGKAHALEPRRVLGHERAVELDRALRRIAFAPGAGDHQQVGLAREIRRARLGHVEELCREPLLGRGLLEIGADTLGVAQFGRVQDRERDPRARRGCGGGRGKRRAGGRGVIAGKEPAQPLPLLGAGARHDRVQRLDVLGRERRAFGEQGQGGRHGHSPRAPTVRGLA